MKVGLVEMAIKLSSQLLVLRYIEMIRKKFRSTCFPLSNGSSILTSVHNSRHSFP